MFLELNVKQEKHDSSDEEENTDTKTTPDCKQESSEYSNKNDHSIEQSITSIKHEVENVHTPESVPADGEFKGTRCTCPYCGKVFKASQMKLHILVHTGERPHKCDECEKSFKQPGHLTLHKFMHLPAKSFKCEQCDQTFTFPQALRRHMNLHQGLKRIKCSEDGCNYQTQIPRLMERHKNKKHRPDSEEFYDPQTGKPREKKCFKCKTCPRRFSYISSLQRHQKYSQCVSFECDQCDYKSPYPKTMEKHKKLHLLEKIAEKLYCESCSFVTFSKRALGQHAIIHKRPSTSLQCPMCDKKVKRHAVLCKHIINIHNSVKNFTCEMCGETFMTEIQLKQHNMDTHRTTDYQCPDCHKYFLNVHSLRKHGTSRNCVKNKRENSTMGESNTGSSENDFDADQEDYENTNNEQPLIGHTMDESDDDEEDEDSDDDDDHQEPVDQEMEPVVKD